MKAAHGARKWKILSGGGNSDSAKGMMGTSGAGEG